MSNKQKVSLFAQCVHMHTLLPSFLFSLTCFRALLLRSILKKASPEKEEDFRKWIHALVFRFFASWYLFFSCELRGGKTKTSVLKMCVREREMRRNFYRRRVAVATRSSAHVFFSSCKFRMPAESCEILTWILKFPHRRVTCHCYSSST